MLFNSIHFVIFFPVVVILYFITPHRYRWILLLIASYYFYMCWKAEYAVLIMVSTLIDYFAALQMDKYSEKSKKKWFLGLSLVTNLGLLFFFKYFNFFSDSIRAILQQFNIFIDTPAFNVLLPVGISFYTFQTLSYTIDVYNGIKKPETHLGKFALYVSFFPQLVAGPIERSIRLLPQIHQHHRFSYGNITSGFKMIVWGYFLKLVVADRAAIYVDAVFNNPARHEGLTFMAATVMFAFQIYGDFAGYSSIAIGTAKVMGYDLMQNFNRPYFARNIRDFWRRWHISLSTWFRDYLYIPLGGNKVARWRWYYNLFITFLISGLWHGANWTFVIWGALHGFYLIVSTITTPLRPEKINRLGFMKYYDVAVTFILASFAWIFFRANTVGDAFYIIKQIFTNPGKLFIPSGADVVAPVYALIAIAAVYILEFKREFFNDAFSVFNHKNAWVRMAAYALMVAMIIYIGVFDGGQFIYFQF